MIIRKFCASEKSDRTAIRLGLCLVISQLFGPKILAQSRTNVLPVPVGFYTPETGAGGGGGIYITYGPENPNTASPSDAKKEPRNLLVPFFVYTEKKQSVARLYWDTWLLENAFKLSSAFGYTNYPDTFFGIGNQTKLQDAETFREVYSSLDIDLEYKIESDVLIGILNKIDNSDIEDKENNALLSSGTTNGADGGVLRGIGGQIRYQDINRTFAPTNGTNLAARLVDYGSIFSSDFKFQFREVRLRKYLPVTNKNTVALEYLIQNTVGKVPFRKLPMLGGQYLLRGFFLGRFRDNALQAIQLENRHTLTDRVGLNVFGSSGVVGPELSSTFESDWHHSIGIGFRYIIIDEDKLGIRLDIARNEEETSIYFGAGEAF